MRIDGTVEGDVIAFTRNLTVTGHVTGDVIGIASMTLIDGTVDGNVRVLSQSIILQGEIGKNLSTVSSSLDLSSKANVGGGAIALAGDGDLDGKIQHDLLGLIGKGDLEGLIGGEAWIRGGSLVVASSGEIRGPATFMGPQPPEVESGAKLASPFRTEITQEIRRNRRTAARSMVRALFGYAAAVAVGVFLLLIVPGFFRAVLREADSIGLPIGIGALALISGAFLFLIGMLLLFIGVGAGMAAAMTYAPIFYVAQVFVGAWLGNKIMGTAPSDSSAALSAWITRLAVGLLILRSGKFYTSAGQLRVARGITVGNGRGTAWLLPNVANRKLACSRIVFLSSTGFSVWGFDLARPKFHRLKPVLLKNQRTLRLQHNLRRNQRSIRPARIEQRPAHGNLIAENIRGSIN